MSSGFEAPFRGRSEIASSTRARDKAGSLGARTLLVGYAECHQAGASMRWARRMLAGCAQYRVQDFKQPGHLASGSPDRHRLSRPMTLVISPGVSDLEPIWKLSRTSNAHGSPANRAVSPY